MLLGDLEALDVDAVPGEGWWWAERSRKSLGHMLELDLQCLCAMEVASQSPLLSRFPRQELLLNLLDPLTAGLEAECWWPVCGARIEA